MDYFKAAFGGFAPHRDEDAAVKFVLNAVLMDDRLQDLSELLNDESPLGGIEGEPGWLLERRGADDRDWPAGTRFKATVHEGAFRLQHSEYFISREALMRYVARAIDAYVAADPARMTASPVVALLKQTATGQE